MADLPLKEFIRCQAEDRPGVYRWLGSEGQILYVGKSIRVKTRLLSYFREERTKSARLVREASDVAWDYIPNEFATLLREMRLIQTWRPEFNVQHKRKKNYAFVKVTREPAPRVVPVTRVANDGAAYYGPFGRVGWVTQTVHDISRVMGLRDCPGDTPVHFDDQLEMFRGGRTPLCLRAETGNCLAPCAGGCSSGDYLARVEETLRFLEGRGSAPIDRLNSDMARSAARKEYEYAAVLRDRRESLAKLQEYLQGFRGRVNGLNLVYRVPGFRGNDRLYLIRQGRVTADLPHPKTDAQTAHAIREVRTVFGANGTTPPTGSTSASAAALTGEAAAEVLLVANWFRTRPKELKRALKPAAWLKKHQRGARMRTSAATASTLSRE